MVLEGNNILVAIGVLLLGSNIALTIPQGSSTGSASVASACATADECAVDAGNQDLQETLADIHGPDDVVLGSVESQGSECFGSSYSDCAIVPTDAFSRHPQLAMLLDSPGATEIQLPGIAGGAGQPRATSTFTVRSSLSTRYYEINGDSSSELWNELRGDANPLSVLPGVGRKPLGQASFVYSYSYQPDQAAGAFHCQVKSGEIDVQFETVLPRLEDLDDKPDRLRRQWKEFQAVVVDHEVGHLEIYRRILDELPQAMSEIGAVPCDELDSRIAAAADRVVDSIQLASSDYDAHVGAGKFTPHQL